MSYKVGSKGQVVIAKDIRDHLNIGPGWFALQHVVDDHVEVYFVPPEHSESLKGTLAKYLMRHVSVGREWEKAREAAWKEVGEEKVKRPEDQGP